jgi:ATP-dependent protease ClpP protease subunit
MTKRKLHIHKANKKDKDDLDVELDIFDDDDDSEEYIIKTDDQNSKTHRIYFPNEIKSDATLYVDLIETFTKATDRDAIHILMYCRGGSCNVGQCIMQAMKKCKAHILVEVVGNSYSMGAMLSLCGDQLIMQPSTFLMFHNYSGGDHGKGAELVAAVTQTDKSLRSLFKNTCSPFLSDGELEIIAADKDIYIHSTDKSLKGRCHRHFPAMKKQFQAEKKKKK